MSFGSWVQAARLPSNVNLVFPLLFGQAMAYGLHGQFEWSLLLWVMLYGWFDQMYIVFWNDYADSAVDAENQTYNIFSGGSRVVPEGKIQPRGLFIAGGICACLVLLVGVLLTLLFQRPAILPLFITGLLLLWMYSFPPVRMNYRGGGELLQGLGCGVLLPVIGYYAQAGTFLSFPWQMLIPFFFFHYASSIATALPDRPADARAVKKTLPVLIGVKGSARYILALCLAGVALTPVLTEAYSFWIGLFSFTVPLLCLVAGGLKLSRIEKDPGAIQLFDALIILLGISYAVGFCMHFWRSA